eukprot:scaffold323951_cov134-Tisochrysis_lutea.AAC.1
MCGQHAPYSTQGRLHVWVDQAKLRIGRCRRACQARAQPKQPRCAGGRLRMADTRLDARHCEG